MAEDTPAGAQTAGSGGYVAYEQIGEDGCRHNLAGLD